MELRALANVEWNTLHPKEPKAKKEPKEPKEPKAKKARKTKEVDPNKPKKEPSLYILFIRGALAELKEEYANTPAEDKPKQTELMKMAAERWNAHKESQA
jgi:hypothetical protein